jgi:NAD(P) transhydrogenase subunit beta
MVPLMIETLLGFLTFTGSLMAMGKLQEVLPQRPITYRGQNLINFTLFGIAAALAVWLIVNPTETWIFPVFAGLSLVFGVLLIIPIGGADMPTVIALLNSYAGLSACAMGFVLGNKMLVIAGALDGSSGLILSIIMCKAMNRSFTNVLFGAFGQLQVAHGHAEKRPVRSASPKRPRRFWMPPRRDHRARLWPGGGAGAAQDPRALRRAHETRRGREVRHPSGGRPHARPHERAAGRGRHPLRPAHRDGRDQRGIPAMRRGPGDRRQRRHQPGRAHDKTSPIYGMPILDVDKAHTVMVIKRSMNPGFAGIDNELYYMDKTLMLFGDAKAFVNRWTRSPASGIRRPGRRAGGRRNGAAVAAHLLPGERVLRVRFQPGMQHFATFGWPLSQCAIASALRLCSSMRTASVLMPRSTRKQSCGPAQVPMAFCRKPIFSASAGVFDDGGAAHHVGMAVDVLGGGMDHDVHAESSGRWK